MRRETIYLKYKILDLANWIPPTAVYEKYGEILEFSRLPETREALLEGISEYDGYISSLKIRMDDEVLDRAKKLKAIFTPSTGLDHIDLSSARARGIPVFATKNDLDILERITSTAEMALALLLGVVRRVPWAHGAAMQGIWAREMFRGHQLSGKTIGILGYGRLGKMMADYAKALRMNVIACDIKEIDADGVRQVSFDELLRESDVISIHVHLNETTEKMISTAEFAKMKDGVVIINTARGGIIDEEAFLEALECGKVGGAGLDVIDGEWMENIGEHPLIKYAREHDNLLISPHTGGTCFEAQEITAENLIQKIDEYFKADGNIAEGTRLHRSLVN